jgi:hypothetical protein
MSEPENMDTTQEPTNQELADDSLDDVVGGVIQENAACMGVRPPK